VGRAARPSATARAGGVWLRGAEVFAVAGDGADQPIDQLVRCVETTALHVDERPNTGSGVERRLRSPVASGVLPIVHTSPLPHIGLILAIAGAQRSRLAGYGFADRPTTAPWRPFAAIGTAQSSSLAAVRTRLGFYVPWSLDRVRDGDGQTR